MRRLVLLIAVAIVVSERRRLPEVQAESVAGFPAHFTSDTMLHRRRDGEVSPRRDATRLVGALFAEEPFKADDYTSDVAYEAGRAEKPEPWEPNVTAMHTAQLKWMDLVTPGTPFPRADGLGSEISVVRAVFGSGGAFEGAANEARGLYRPEVDCLMFTRDPVGFCRVCRRAIVRIIDLYSR